jgi:hypothetical protein
VSNEQLYFAIGLPCLTVIASMVINLVLMSGLREDIREIRGDIKSVNGKLGAMDVELGKLMDRAK